MGIELRAKGADGIGLSSLSLFLSHIKIWQKKTKRFSKWVFHVTHTRH